MFEYITADDTLSPRDGTIKLYGPEAFEGMARAGALVAETLDMIMPYVVPNVTTQALDDRIRDFVHSRGANIATMGYRGYSHASCISHNHVICHGIPGPKKLKDGDIVNIDVTVVIDGWHGDHSRMYSVGKVGKAGQRLMSITYDALMAGIGAVKPGNRVADIAKAISDIAKANRLSVVEDFCGHGLGQLFHDEPNIVHSWGPFPRMSARFGEDGQPVKTQITEEEAYAQSPELKPGMLFTIEPMLNLGAKAGKLLDDGWTAVTRDKKLSAQFEHSVGVTQTGVQIFTQSPKGWHTPHTVSI